MPVNAVKLVYFSPTHTTQRIVESIAQGMDIRPLSSLDLTLPPGANQTLEVDRDTLAIIGVPVYGGRLPVVAVQRLQWVLGDGGPAVIVVVYGNRAYEDALLELKDMALARGFVPMAGAAFIGEHSYSTTAMPIAPGRPDAEDIARAMAFGQQVRARLLQTSMVNLPPLDVPGHFPYKERRPAPASPPTPTTIADLCTLCGRCAAVCPTAAITVSETVITKATACIACCACTRACPTGARVMEDPRIRQTATWLYENHSARKEPEIFFGDRG